MQLCVATTCTGRRLWAQRRVIIGRPCATIAREAAAINGQPCATSAQAIARMRVRSRAHVGAAACGGGVAVIKPFGFSDLKFELLDTIWQRCLTRSARTDSPRQVGRNKFRRLEGGGGGSTRAAAAAAYERRGEAALALGLGLGDGFGSGPMGPGPTDEHSVHLHHRDFIVTPIADQIGPIDSVFKTEYYDLKNHFSELQCKMTVFPFNIGKS
ncbi:hypothetical protein F511_45332 [Dorcoceras hygrometricum]|uniref:Uncharacterized protein n=1 Tax=Dorcoceras hygrometricum TaxID=472368 RepID=A0A2Z7A3G8_9LAMI|nr:hypothetical protein F511_45332 [Dorcoceras hygrometricum]